MRESIGAGRRGQGRSAAVDPGRHRIVAVGGGERGAVTCLGHSVHDGDTLYNIRTDNVGASLRGRLHVRSKQATGDVRNRRGRLVCLSGPWGSHPE